MIRLLREALGGLLFAVITVSTVLGGIVVAFYETGEGFPIPTAISGLAQISPTPTPPIIFFTPLPITPSITPTEALLPTATSTPCIPVPPVGWALFIIGPDDTLVSLASRTGTNAQAIAQVNCLDPNSVFAGTVIFLPPVVPTPVIGQTPTVVACGPPPNWVFYTVQPGDTLFRLSQRFRTTLLEIQLANCFVSVSIQAGQQIYLPPGPAITNTPIIIVITATPSLTPIPTLTPTPLPGQPPQPTATHTVPAPTSPPVATATFTATSTIVVAEATETPTATDVVAATPSDTPTNTPIPDTETPTSTPSETPSQTPEPTTIDTPEPTATEETPPPSES